MGSKNTSLKVVLLATACGVAFAGTASAADMMLKAPAVAAIPVSNWTGWYVGALVGVGSSTNYCQPNAATSDQHGCAAEGRFHTNQAITRSSASAVAGADIGYDWQSRYFVYGVAADWTWTHMKGSVAGRSGSYSYQSKIDWLASFRGRMGLAIDNTMVYVTGGLALGGVKNSYSVNNFNDLDQGTARKTAVGWVAGVGVEHRFTRNWSIKGEYLHYDLGTYTSNLTVDSGSSQQSFKHSNVVDVARIGLTYRP